MLSILLKPISININEEVSIKEYIIKLIQNINIKEEKEDIIKLIFL